MVKQRNKVCEKCGSDDIVFDAYARWCARKDMFELGPVFEYTYCNSCDNEIDSVDVELDEDVET